MMLSLIVAVAENGVIGRAGALPWRLPGDLAWFKAQTMGKPIVMGRKTWDSLPRKPLTGRRNIVVTRQAHLKLDGADIVRSLEAAIARAGAVPEIVVIGGADLFALALPLASRLYLTEVKARPEGDVFMPSLGDGWREISRTSNPAQGDQPAYDFVILERAR
jgi:dihydrofolate reductase